MPPTNADLERGRELYAHEAWAGAFESLERADRAAPLQAPDLELLAQSAYLLGRDDEFFVFLERAHHARLDDGELARAANCAFWIGMNFALRGEMGPATGWLGRAQRLVDQVPEDCVERGYLLMPVAFQHDAAGDFEGASATAAAAVEIGERFGDRDLFALAMHGQGGWLIKAGRVREGLGLLDEAMVAATSGELSPIVTGIVYCGVIAACEEVYDLRRAQEWTAALKEWCDRQPDLMSFTGRCMVHRAEIMQLHGAWTAAVEEAQRAGARFERAMNTGAAAKASYLQGDVHRLRGELGCRGGRVQGSEPLRLGAPAGARPVAARAGQRRRRCRRDPSRPGRDDGHTAAREPPPGVRPDHARRRRRRSSARRVPRARGDLGAVRERRAGRDARPGAGSGRACRR